MTEPTVMVTPTIAEGRMRGRFELKVAVLLACCFGTVMLDRMIQLFLGPQLVADLHLRPSEIGLLAGAVSICWAASTLVFGVISDRIGRKRVLVPAMVIFSLLSWVSGMATTFGQLLLIRALLGLAEGPCWSVIMALMEEHSGPERRGRNIGIVICAGSLVGSSIGPIFATQIAAEFGWRSAFFAAGIPGLLLAGLVALLIPEPTRNPRQSTDRSGLLTMLSSRDLWLCFAAALLLTVWIFGFNAFAPLYMTRDLGLQSTQSGWILGASGFGGFLFCLFWPAFSDRIGRRPALITAAAVATLLPLAFLFHGFPPTLLGAFALVTTSGPAIAALAMVLVPMELVPPKLAATSVGFVSIGGDAFGATLGPILGGYLAEAAGLGAPLVMAACASAGIMVICFFMRETLPEEVRLARRKT